MSAADRRDELLALRAVEGLAEPEHHELEGLLDASTGDAPERLERAAAALDLAMAAPGAEETLPVHLEAQILEGAADWFRSRSSQSPNEAPLDVLAARTVQRDIFQPWAPWLLAAAAALVALVGWWPRPDADVSLSAPSLAQIESAPDALVRGWDSTDDPTATGAAGEVVWSTTAQAGFMRITSLAVNDPTVEQYQLWIFDRTRDERYPVDGGVFDMPAGADEAVVPIDAKVAVAEPYLFAVTVEKPGGVVVSSRERIALVAEV